MKPQPSAIWLVLTFACVGLGCGGPNGQGQGSAAAERPSGAAARESGAPLNATCPRSGAPVAGDSLTEYRGHVVGFCNPHCRDDFAAHVAERPADRAAFDALIEGLIGGLGADGE